MRKVYSDGEYAHKFYSGRRVWGAYRLFGLDHLPSNYTDMRLDVVYPATAKLPAGRAKVLPSDLFAIHRDYYQASRPTLSLRPTAGPTSQLTRPPALGPPFLLPFAHPLASQSGTSQPGRAQPAAIPHYTIL